MKKRYLSMLLAFIMVFMCVSTASFADEDTAVEGEETPVEIVAEETVEGASVEEENTVEETETVSAHQGRGAHCHRNGQLSQEEERGWRARMGDHLAERQ